MQQCIPVGELLPLVFVRGLCKARAGGAGFLVDLLAGVVRNRSSRNRVDVSAHEIREELRERSKQ